MLYEKMVKSIDTSILPDVEMLVRQFRQRLPRVYSEKDINTFSHALDSLLKMGVKLNQSPMLLYLPARPRFTGNLVSQFQAMNKILATKEQNKDWYHDLFALFVAIPGVLALSWDEIENKVIELNQIPSTY